MAKDFGYCWCQDCRKWVPAEKMNYFNGYRVCIWCMEGTPQPSELIYDPHHEETQCIFCDSYNTAEQKSQRLIFKCNDCGETFRRI